jgi:hypothetical protein
MKPDENRPTVDQIALDTQLIVRTNCGIVDISPSETTP